MRVLLVSDLAATGFGRVGRELATGLIGRGHEVRIIGVNWRGAVGELEALVRRGYSLRLAAAEIEDDPLARWTMPAARDGDGMGTNLLYPAITGRLWAGWQPDAAIIVADPRAMFGRLLGDGGSLSMLPVFNYVPIEGTGLPPVLRSLWDVVTPVAMSRFGQAQLEQLLDRPVALALHGVSAAFRPLSPTDPGRWQGRTAMTKDGAKEAINATGQLVILRTDRYILRKNYPGFFRVLRPVLAKHPEAIAVVHTVLQDDVGWGDIRELLSREPGAVKIGPGYFDWDHAQIHFTGAHDSFRGLADEDLRVLYGAADIYLSPTMAEGFGLCLAEAMACEVPVIATDYSAVGEVVGPGGILIPPAATFTNPYSHEWALVDEAAMSEALERLASKPALRRKLGAAGRRHVAQFTWGAAVDVFDRLITDAVAVAA